ncbi:MAG TPA: hypothetical protein ENK31_00840 [Nannocystis exedens]|nr:hypothetical protein [Nannocystis exedens]
MPSRRSFLAATAGLFFGVVGCHHEGTTIPVGTQLAPSFATADAAGQSVSLAGMLAKGPAVVVFYRGFW